MPLAPRPSRPLPALGLTARVFLGTAAIVVRPRRTGRRVAPSEDVVRAHAELPSVCEHVHLPLQAGSTRILKRMRRTYARGRYMDRVALLRTATEAFSAFPCSCAYASVISFARSAGSSAARMA